MKFGITTVEFGSDVGNLWFSGFSDTPYRTGYFLSADAAIEFDSEQEAQDFIRMWFPKSSYQYLSVKPLLRGPHSNY